MKRALVAIGLAAAVLGLAACKDNAAPRAAGTDAARAASAQKVSIEAVEAQARGFSVGPVMSANVVYVFFDPQCPHCAALWQAAKPLKQVRFVWIPVGVLNGNSVTQGAAILAAPDPAAAMDAHEAALREQRGGIIAAGNTDAQKKWVEQNTKLLDGFGIGSVPALVARHAQSRAVIVQEGAMPTGALAQWLGIPAPAGP